MIKKAKKAESRRREPPAEEGFTGRGDGGRQAVDEMEPMGRRGIGRAGVPE